MFDEDDTDALGMLGDADDGTLPRRQKRGDGRPLEPFRWWHLVSGRKLFSLAVPRPGAPDTIMRSMCGPTTTETLVPTSTATGRTPSCRSCRRSSRSRAG